MPCRGPDSPATTTVTTNHLTMIESTDLKRLDADTDGLTT